MSINLCGTFIFLPFFLKYYKSTTFEYISDIVEFIHIVVDLQFFFY